MFGIFNKKEETTEDTPVVIRPTPTIKPKYWSNQTHTGYPEIQILQDERGAYRWKLRIYSYAGCGEILESTSGSSTNRQAAKMDACRVRDELMQNVEV